MNFQSSSVEITALILIAMVLSLVAMPPLLRTSINYFLYACSLKLELPTQFLMFGIPMKALQLYLESPEQESLFKV